GTSAKPVAGGRKRARTVPSVPLDNVSFHHEEGASRWKFICERRVVVEKSLNNELLNCQELM
ncbi:envelope-like protein, partial [Trifolium medium]|nr:envelope-like protein [Trifolium medium]